MSEPLNEDQLDKTVSVTFNNEDSEIRVPGLHNQLTFLLQTNIQKAVGGSGILITQVFTPSSPTAALPVASDVEIARAPVPCFFC